MNKSANLVFLKTQLILFVLVMSLPIIAQAAVVSPGIQAASNDQGLAQTVANNLNSGSGGYTVPAGYTAQVQNANGIGATYGVYVVPVGGGAANNDDDNGPTYSDPRAYERWRVIGDIGFWGRGYDYINRPCTGAPGEDKNRCNNSCIALDGWACDTRSHERPVRLNIYVDGTLYDTILPTGSRPTYTNFDFANQQRYNYTPSCGDAPGNLYGFNYPTPPAWKDGRTRNIQIQAVTASTTINQEFYRSNTRLSSYGPILTSSELAIYGITGSYGSTRYRFMYTGSEAPTTVNLVNAGWREGMSNAYKNFSITCPVIPPAIDLSGQLLGITNQVVNQAYNVNGTIRNLGTAPARQDVSVKLEFDFGRNGFINGRNNDFQVYTTLGALTAGANGNARFPGITHTVTGPWQVRMIVDPGNLIETDPASPLRRNNQTGWQIFNVTTNPTTPTLDLTANTPVTAGSDVTLWWFSQNIRANSCTASGDWSGSKNAVDIDFIPTSVAGPLTFTLTCTGTNNQPITDTVTVQVIGTTPDLTFDRINFNTCTPAQVNQTNNTCPNTTVTAVIKNQGVAIPSNVRIPYRLEKQVGAARVAIPGATGNLSGLGAGANSGILTFNVPNLPVGSNRIVARVNTASPVTVPFTPANPAIGETRFGNNATTTPFFTIVGLPPDYTPTAFSITRTCPPGAQNQTTGACLQTDVSGTIRNSGGATPTGRTISYVIQEDRGGTWTNIPGTLRTTPAIAANASRPIPTITIPNLSVGAHSLRLMVNPVPDPRLTETNFGNNASNPANANVPALPPECDNNNRNDDPAEDTLTDRKDPGCWDNNGTYDPNDDTEAGVIPPPALTISASSQTVRYDSPVTISYSIASIYPVQCTLTGPGMPSGPITYTAATPMVAQRGTEPSLNITGTQRFTIRCTPGANTQIVNPASAETSVAVDVIPQAQEI